MQDRPKVLGVDCSGIAKVQNKLFIPAFVQAPGSMEQKGMFFGHLLSIGHGEVDAVWLDALVGALIELFACAEQEYHSSIPSCGPDFDRHRGGKLFDGMDVAPLVLFINPEIPQISAGKFLKLPAKSGRLRVDGHKQVTVGHKTVVDRCLQLDAANFHAPDVGSVRLALLTFCAAWGNVVGSFVHGKLLSGKIKNRAGKLSDKKRIVIAI